MNDKIKHWIIVLERIKTQFMWTPQEVFPTTDMIDALIKEMKEEIKEKAA